MDYAECFACAPFHGLVRFANDVRDCDWYRQASITFPEGLEVQVSATETTRLRTKKPVKKLD